MDNTDKHTLLRLLLEDLEDDMESEEDRIEEEARRRERSGKQNDRLSEEEASDWSGLSDGSPPKHGEHVSGPQYTATLEKPVPEEGPINIAIIGVGTIGLSFIALHINENPRAWIQVYDTRENLETYVHENLPSLLQPSHSGKDFSSNWTSRVIIRDYLEDAVEHAHIVQEQGPENAAFKTALWKKVERSARKTALFWSSTSGIPASVQSAKMKKPGRLVVVHPYNPPHIMPLLEVIPGVDTTHIVLNATVKYWQGLGRAPVVLHKETTGFVANRLAFALLREAISLVQEGVIDVAELDALVENSMGPRWAVAGPFKSYHAGGGENGLAGFFQNIGGTVRDCWKASEKVNVGVEGGEWEESISKETEKAYGRVDVAERNRVTKALLKVVKEEKERSPEKGPSIAGTLQSESLDHPPEHGTKRRRTS